jgi:hypothetical protein
MMSNQVNALLHELLAIDHLVDRYERHRNPAWNETVAYVFRQTRRGEIIRQMLCLVAVQERTE